MYHIQVFFKNKGDGLLLAFDEAVDVVNCHNKIIDAQKSHDFILVSDDYGHSLATYADNISHSYLVHMDFDQKLGDLAFERNLKMEMDRALIKADKQMEFQKRHGLRTGARGEIN